MAGNNKRYLGLTKKTWGAIFSAASFFLTYAAALATKLLFCAELTHISFYYFFFPGLLMLAWDTRKKMLDVSETQKQKATLLVKVFAVIVMVLLVVGFILSHYDYVPIPRFKEFIDQLAVVQCKGK